MIVAGRTGHGLDGILMLAKDLTTKDALNHLRALALIRMITHASMDSSETDYIIMKMK